MGLELELGMSIRRWMPAGVFSPDALFVPGIDGGWYDPSDLTTLWQDSARTTPVTASGQPVGCMDDKSGNGRNLLQTTAVARPTYLAGDTPATFGAELVVNGGFDADTDWTKGSGWTISGGVAVCAVGTTTALTQNITLTAGKLYRVVWTMLNRVAGAIGPRFTGGTVTQAPDKGSNATFTQYIRAETGNTTLSFQASVTDDFQIDNVSVKEVLTFTGYPCLWFDGVDDCMASAATFTVQLPVWNVCAMQKAADVSGNLFGMVKGTTDYAVVRNTATASERMTGGVREAVIGAETVNTAIGAVPLNTPKVAGSLSVVGTTGIAINGGTPVTVANTWLAGTQLTTSAIVINSSTVTPTAVAHVILFFGGIALKADPGVAGRANAVRWLGGKVGLVL